MAATEHTAAGPPPGLAVTVSSSTAAVRAVVASDLRLLREGLSDSLARRMSITVIASVGDSYGVLSAIEEFAPDVLLLDIGIPHSLPLVQVLCGTAAQLKILAFAVTDSEADLVACIEAGVAGFLPRDGSLDDLVLAIESVARGELLVSPKIAGSLSRRLAVLGRACRGPQDGHRIATDVDPVILTAREAEVLALLDEGLANKDIARRLGIEVATVKNHVHHILEKLQVSRRGQAAARARWRTGILEPVHGRAAVFR
jgi:two-component system, NarL family, nitrate/nitrite response regulator NarL